MSTAQLLTEIRRRGIRLLPEGNRLVAEGPIGDELADRLRQHRNELRATLLGAPCKRTAPCAACGSGAFYRAAVDDRWRCWCCAPPTGRIAASVALPGGRVPGVGPRDADLMTARAAEAAGVDAAALRRALAPEDETDIAAGRVDLQALIAYARGALRE